MLASVLSASIEGLIFSIAVLGLALTLRLLDYPDLTFDGSLVLGAALSSKLLVAGLPLPLALAAAPLGGVAAGLATAFLHTYLGISKLLSGIISMTVLFTINLRIMGSANISLLRETTLFVPLGRELGIALMAGAVLTAVLSLRYFLTSRTGVTLRGVGMNRRLASALGFDHRRYLFLGLALANGLIACSGSLMAQLHRYADVSDGLGAILGALAALVIGESILRPETVKAYLFAPVGGSLAYYLVVMVALRLGLPPTDLKLLTGLLLVAVLVMRFGRSATDFFRSTW